MRQALYIFLLGMAMVACTGGHGVKHVAQPSDTLYTEPKAMSLHCTEPERALLMIDSAIIVGNISPVRGEYLKAVTQYGGMGNKPLARQICLDMLAHRDAITDSITVERTYLLLAIIERVNGNYPAVIRYATEASRLAHALDMPDEVGSMEGYIAEALARTGKTDEAVERLKHTISELRTMNSFAGVTSYHSTAKKLLHILLDNNRLAEMIPLCESVLKRIGELESHPDQFSGISDGFTATEYVDMARGQILAFMATSYARQHKLREARQADAEIQRTQWGKTVDCDRMMSAAYHYMGEFDRFDKAMRRFENDYPDTINANVIICLEQRSEACEMQGRPTEALHYMQRAKVIRDSLDYRNQRDQLNELATVYHLQEEQLTRQEAEADARFYRWLTAAILIALIAAMAFTVYFFRKRRETLLKNRALVRMIDEMHSSALTEAPVAPTVSVSPVDMALFEQFTSLIHDEQLYRDAALDRDTVCQRLDIDRHVLNQLLNTYANGLSLPAYINRVRLDVAYELLHGEPDRSIADIAAAVGFTPQNLRLQFKKRYGITPTEYRQNQ